jgi:osmotically-inducible protein OsmY
MPDRNYYLSRGRQGRESQGRWGEGDDPGRRADREFDDDVGINERPQYGQQPQYGRDRSDEERHTGRGDRGASNYGQPSFGREYGSSGTSQYGRSDYGGRGSYGGSDRGSSWRGYGGGAGDSGWTEPFGEGQQYGSDYGSYAGSYGGSAREGRFGQRGEHRGKGPKGYQRTDERLKEMICERLREDPEIDPSEVTISVSGSRVTLDGSVDSRRTKNSIEDIIEQFDVHDVQNNLRVTREAGRSGQSGSEWGKSVSTGSSGRGMGGGEEADPGRQKRN